VQPRPPAHRRHEGQALSSHTFSALSNLTCMHFDPGFGLAGWVPWLPIRMPSACFHSYASCTCWGGLLLALDAATCAGCSLQGQPPRHRGALHPLLCWLPAGLLQRLEAGFTVSTQQQQQQQQAAPKRSLQTPKGMWQPRSLQAIDAPVYVMQ